MSPQIYEYIKELEQEGKLDPTCKTCKTIFYPAIEKGMKYHNIFAPSHKALATCKSGKYPHCTCDTCF